MSSDQVGFGAVQAGICERVSVIIPNWNGERFLGPCLTALRRQTYKDFVAYLVDNGSKDDSIAFVRDHYPEVRVVALPRNAGFAAGMNAGILACRGEFVAALNNDTEADPRWLEHLVSTLDAHPEIAFCASKIVNHADRSLIDCIGDGYTRSGLAFKIASRERDRGQFAVPFPVVAACAAASIYRRAMLSDIGVFDEDFFCYMEDVDLSIRALLAGYHCVAVPSAVVYHVGSGSTGGTVSEFSLQMTTKNLFNILAKDIPGRLLPHFLLRTVALQLAVVVACVFSRRFGGIRRNFRGYLRGLGGAFRQLPSMWAKRRRVQAARRISARDFAAVLRACERDRPRSQRVFGAVE